MLKTVLFTLTTASLITSAAAGDLKLGSKKGKEKDTKGMVWDDQIIKDLYGSKLAKEYADTNQPVIDTVDQGPRCKDISASYAMNMPLYEQSVASIPFTAGVAAELALEASNDKLAVTGSLGPSIDVFGGVRTPLDLKLSASTSSAGLNSVDVSVTAFGYTLFADTLADSTTPIEMTESFGWSLPDVFTAELSDSLWIGNMGSRVRNAEATWKLSATAQAHVGGILLFSVGTNGVQARALVSNDAYAALLAEGAFTAEVDPPDFQSDWHGFKMDLKFSTTFDMIRSTFGGRGLLVPHNGRWVADAAASLSLTDTMGAYIGTTISIPIPIFDDPSYEFSLIDLAPTSWNDSWKYSCTFDRKSK